MATKAEREVVESTLYESLGMAKRAGKKSFSEMRPSIEHIIVQRDDRISDEDGTVYRYLAIVPVGKYPDENQMDWFKTWESELINNHTSSLKIKYVFFDENEDLCYVFEGVVVK